MNKQIRRRIAVGALALAASLGVGSAGASAAQPARTQVTQSSSRHFGQYEHRSLGHYWGRPLGHWR